MSKTKVMCEIKLQKFIYCYLFLYFFFILVVYYGVNQHKDIKMENIKFLFFTAVEFEINHVVYYIFFQNLCTLWLLKCLSCMAIIGIGNQPMNPIEQKRFVKFERT